MSGTGPEVQRRPRTFLHRIILNNNIGLTQNLGKVLFNEYILPFEVSAILFLAAMVGAVYLGKKQLD